MMNSTNAVVVEEPGHTHVLLFTPFSNPRAMHKWYDEWWFRDLGSGVRYSCFPNIKQRGLFNLVRRLRRRLDGEKCNGR